MVEGTEAEVDGKRVALVNLSVVGAQVCSASVLTPKQRVTVVFAYQQQSLQIPSVIASVSAETADGHVRYRAGIEFLDVNQSAVQRIIDSKRK